MCRNMMRKMSVMLIGLCVCLLVCTPVLAATDSAAEKTQIIFLLDASQSMEKEGRWADASDSACMISAALPENYEAALLVYNSEILYREDFGKIGQGTRNVLEKIEMGGYTAPGIALETACSMFGTDATSKRVVFLTDGEISMRNAEATAEALGNYESAVETAEKNNVRIDMFVLPDEDTSNEVKRGTEATSGELYTAGRSQTLEDISVKYLFDLLGIERIDLGEAQTEGEKITVDLQDTYMKNAKILLIAGKPIQDFHVMGQCEEVSVMQGNKVAVAELTNPMQDEVVIDYILEERVGVHAYLIKEYDLKAEIGQAYTSGSGDFDIEVSVLNHQGRQVLDAEHLKDAITISINGTDTEYRVENKTALLAYKTDATESISIEVQAEASGNMIYTSSMAGIVELTVPVVEEKPDYTVLWIVIGVLAVSLILLVVIYNAKKQKKTIKAGKKARASRSF